MKIRLPFLVPFLWKSSAKSGAAAENTTAKATYLPPKASQRAKRETATFNPYWTTADSGLTIPAPVHLRSTPSTASQSSRPRRSTEQRATITTAAPKDAPIRPPTNPRSPQRSQFPNTGARPRTHFPNPPLYSFPLDRACLNTTVKRRRPADTIVQRYGVANEPPPQFKAKGKAISPPPEPPKPDPEQRLLPEPDEGEKKDVPASAMAAILAAKEGGAQKQPSSEVLDVKANTSTKPQAKTSPNVIQLGAPEIKSTPTGQNQSALGLILGMNVTSQGLEEAKPPHLQPAPFEHHFDTYSLVQELEKGGFTQPQAILVMKAIRGILAERTDIAQDGILSKADAEMATYLFKAACHELKTEIKNNRLIASERNRTDRTALTHELDILTQRITAELNNLRDELRGLFDDRKMSARIEKRDMVENKIQELNYKITAKLTSELRGETEKLRWILVKRVASGVAGFLLVALSIAQFASAMNRKKAEKERADRERRDLEVGGAGPGNLTLGGIKGRPGEQTGAVAEAGGIVRGMAVDDTVHAELLT